MQINYNYNCFLIIQFSYYQKLILLILHPTQFWGEVSQLNFRQVSPDSKADIDIKFVTVSVTIICITDYMLVNIKFINNMN